jgi:hypothetical protein
MIVSMPMKAFAGDQSATELRTEIKERMPEIRLVLEVADSRALMEGLVPGVSPA